MKIINRLEVLDQCTDLGSLDPAQDHTEPADTGFAQPDHIAVRENHYSINWTTTFAISTLQCDDRVIRNPFLRSCDCIKAEQRSVCDERDSQRDLDIRHFHGVYVQQTRIMRWAELTSYGKDPKKHRLALAFL